MTEKDEIKTALVTGATGFIGSHLVRRLVKDGWCMHIIVRPSSNLKILENILDNITVHSHDGTTEDMIRIIKKAKPQVVFHLASLFLAEHEVRDVKPLIQSNVLFGTQLVEAMIANDAQYLINTGTAWQHFENELYNPVCLYAATKQAFEDILCYYTATSSLKVTTLKLYDTYGPHDFRHKLIPLLRKTAKAGEKLLMSPGEQLVDLVYIDDVVEAFIVAIQQLKKQNDAMKIYAISSEAPVRLRDLVCAYEEVTGERLNIKWGGRPYRRREVMIPWNRGVVLPGWRPRFCLTDGLRRTLCVPMR